MDDTGSSIGSTIVYSIEQVENVVQDIFKKAVQDIFKNVGKDICLNIVRILERNPLRECCS